MSQKQAHSPAIARVTLDLIGRRSGRHFPFTDLPAPRSDLSVPSSLDGDVWDLRIRVGELLLEELGTLSVVQSAAFVWARLMEDVVVQDRLLDFRVDALGGQSIGGDGFETKLSRTLPALAQWVAYLHDKTEIAGCVWGFPQGFRSDPLERLLSCGELVIPFQVELAAPEPAPEPDYDMAPT